MLGSVSDEAKKAVDSFMNPDFDKRLGSTGVRDSMSHGWFDGFDWEGMKSGVLEAPEVEAVKDLFNMQMDEQFLKRFDEFEERWALGVLTCEMITGKNPFGDGNDREEEVSGLQSELESVTSNTSQYQ